jgi:hypothetical protein
MCHETDKRLEKKAREKRGLWTTGLYFWILSEIVLFFVRILFFDFKYSEGASFT